MSDDLVNRLRSLKDYGTVHEAADRIEELESALREISETFVSSLTFKVADMKHKYDLPFGKEHAEEVYQELGRRIMIARKALEGEKDD